MGYTIRKSDGTLLIDLADGTTDVSKTSLTLIGKNVSEFGKAQNENFVRMLEHFASTVEPVNPLQGQFWFNKTNEQVFVRTSTGFRSIGPFTGSTTQTVDNNSTATATTAFVHSVIPLGSIIMWYGTIIAIPAGWALCNGQTVNGVTTPDLRDRFIIGAGNDFVPGNTGGARTTTSVAAHTHGYSGNSSVESADHTHSGVTASAGNHNHGMPGDDQLSFANNVAGWVANSRGAFNYDARSVGGGGAQVWDTTSAGNHNHTITTGGQSGSHTHSFGGTTSATGSASVDILNPYYALAFIMKVI